jgi:hypothetical protein
MTRPPATSSSATPSGSFCWLLELTAIDFYCWVDARRVALPDQGDLTSDLIAACRVKGGFEALCVEVQTVSAVDTVARLLYGYVPRLRSEPSEPASLPLLAVVGLVLNLTGPPQTTAVHEVSRLAPRCRFEGAVTAREVRDELAATLLAAVAAGRATRWLLAWLPLMRGGKEPGTIEGWKREAARLVNERDRSVLAHLTLTFAELTRCRGLWERALEGWVVIVSPYMEELRQREKAEGKLEEARAMLLLQGRKKFGRAPTKKQLGELSATTDLARLEALGERLLDVNTWAELLAAPEES